MTKNTIRLSTNHLLIKAVCQTNRVQKKLTTPLNAIPLLFLPLLEKSCFT